MTFHWADGFHPKVAEAGWWPFSGCGWLFASPKECLEDIVKDAKDAAHFTAHIAGMIHTRSAKAWAEQSASRSAEALDQAQNALKEVRRIETWQNSLGPSSALAAVARSPERPLREPERCPRGCRWRMHQLNFL
ncbi:unnamed protein product [Durusdinium trenchii]|uniref:Uncharacterized protein n=1 Tax=Durusdinium trenchii TaxID=1381693 RepID=A0ABP0LPW4_9DINO